MERAVFEFIDRHQSFEALLKEASDEVGYETSVPEFQETPGSAKNVDSAEKKFKLSTWSIDACLSCLQVKSHVSGMPITTVAALECAKELGHLLQAPPSINSEEKKKCTQCLIGVLRSLASQQLLNRPLFIDQLSSKVETVPLELLWQLHNSSAISLESYLERNLTCPAVLQSFRQNASAICLRTNSSDEERMRIKKDILEVLVRCGYSKSEEGVDTDKKLASICQQILDKILLDVLSVQIQANKNEPSSNIAELLEIIHCSPSIGKDAISRFSKRLLRNLLRTDSDRKVTTAITKQHDHWTYAKAPSSQTRMFVQLLLTVDEKQVFAVLQEVLESQMVNWQYTLILVSVFCVCFRQGAALIKGLVENLLKESLQNFQLPPLHAAFLLARQAAAEGSHDFPSYSRWFKEQFNTASGPHLASSKTFTFFMEFLNSLVPHEPAHCLKAHIQNPPYTPAKYRDICFDYVALAKTRLTDFKESWQTSDAIGSSSSSKAQTGDQLAVEDVEMAVTHYEKTGSIHGKVLQLSIFRKPYFIGQFLPTLLTSRVLPDTPDRKMKFIKALKREEKIPLAMYNKYVEACAAELAIILEGVSSEDMDEMMTQPMDRLQDCLDLLPQKMITEIRQASHYTDVSSHMLQIADRVKAVLEELNILPADATTIEGARTILLDIEGGSSIEPTIMQVTDLLLSWFCKTYLLMAKAGVPFAVLADRFTAMLATQGALHLPLYHRLFTLICHQGKTLAEDHIKGLAILLVHMNAQGERLPPVKLQTHSKHRQKQLKDGEPDQMPLLNLISKNLPMCTGDAMKFSLKFCNAVLGCVSDLPQAMQSRVTPQVLKQKSSYLQPRLDPVCRLECASVQRPSPSSSQPTTSSDESTEETEVSNQDQMTFQDWLRQELRVHLCKDCLNQKQRKKYHHWALYTLYLPHNMQPTQSENTRGAYKLASTEILHALLDRYAEPAVTTDEYCPHEAKPYLLCGCSSSNQEILQLLLELLPVWSPAMPQSTAASAIHTSWLLAEFRTRLCSLTSVDAKKDNANHGLAAGVDVSNQIMLSQSLPTYLLFTDNLRILPKQNDLSNLSDYINTHLREHAQEDFGILSYEIVAVILQGILQLYTHVAQTEPTRLQSVAVITARLLQNCPIFTLSALSHWDMLTPVIGQLNSAGSNQQHPLGWLNLVRKLGQAVVKTESSACLMSPNKLHVDTCMIVVMSSVMQLVQRTSSLEELTCLEVKLYQTLQETFKKDDIRRALFECHVAQTAWFLLTCPAQTLKIEAHCQAAGLVLKEQPRCLMDCTGSTTLRRQVLQKSVSSLYPLVCFRIIGSNSCLSVLQKASDDYQLLATIVQLYTSLVHLHCQANQPIPALLGHEVTGGQQLLDLNFVQSSQNLVRKIIARSSRQTLTAVNATISAGTDPQLRHLIAQKLKSVPL